MQCVLVNTGAHTKIFSGAISNYVTWKDGGITAAPFLRLAIQCMFPVRSMRSFTSRQSANMCGAPTLCKHYDGAGMTAENRTNKIFAPVKQIF